MAQPARLSGALLACKGHALPSGGLPAASFPPEQSVPLARSPRLEAVAPANLQPAPARSGPTSPASREARVKMTVRLEPDQHERLRIFAARRRCTGQEVFLRALDAYMEACGLDCACLRVNADAG